MAAFRFWTVALALMAAVAFQVTEADARIGGGSSFGSRGSRTFSAPPTTSTAPSQAAPIGRSFTQPGVQSPNRPGAVPSRFGGFGSLLVGGLLGAGLFGLLSGSGLFGGLTGFASVIGLLLQLALIGGVIWLVMAYLRSRNQPGYASAGGASPFSNQSTAPNSMESGSRPWIGAGGSAQDVSGPLAIKQEDYQAFEKLLTNTQAAYGRNDINALGAFTTPEMLSYLSGELAENTRKGVHNEVSNAKFISGDLAEAWTENGSDYATLAMKYSIVDSTVEIATGRVISGDRIAPQEVVELWTFRRDHRYMSEGWQLSAIQQTGIPKAA